ncbi:MAG: carboxy-S-adenosyl-L-methionine synthase CmoA [Planctomycetota bacterium]|nr:carboxy-S-adenosyl-L-methionine synthase CmoA [Planctomycetota bacterium]MDA1180119.1 carboxy-S-adenosyl-L-methionine synthase CmoA [Planctomycetota bacterium]
MAKNLQSPATDRLFASTRAEVEAFRFDEQVATVFPDMIARSVPGYAEVLNGLTALARRVVVPHSRVYDLGCSLGAATLAVLNGIEHASVHMISVDNSSAMIDRARERVGSFKHSSLVELILADIVDIVIQNASLVLLNYTLQFIPVDLRDLLCQRIYEGLRPGGVLVLSEKIVSQDPVANALIIDLHEDFKRCQGYSELEIAQKRTALEGVLVPETQLDHQHRLQRSGFTTVTPWFQHYNFVSMLAVKCGS